MRQLGYLKEVLGRQYVAREYLTFLEKNSPAELTIPFIMDNVKVEAKTLTGIRQMLREQLALLRQGQGLTWKTIMVSSYRKQTRLSQTESPHSPRSPHNPRNP